MIVSQTEAETMIAKAMSGAGRAWGIAQEAAPAVVRLQAGGLPGAAAAVELLRATDGLDLETLMPAITGNSLAAGSADAPALCPVLVGCYLADLHHRLDGLAVRNVHSPLLLLPFVCRAATAVQVSWDDGCAGFVDGRFFGEGALHGTRAAEVNISTGQDGKPAGQAPQTGGVDIACDLWEALNEFASRTYVPATEASRLKGAGAGLTDND